MTELQTRAFKLAAAKLSPTSKFYSEDMESLRLAYSKKTDDQCREVIGRLSHVPTRAEMDRHCQFGGIGFQ